MIRQKNLANFSSSTIHVPIVELRRYLEQARNLIPIESGCMRAAKRGENRVHSRSVLKFQEAKVGVLVTKVLSFSLYLAVTYADFPREIHFCHQIDLLIYVFTTLFSLLSLNRDVQYSSVSLSLSLARFFYTTIAEYRPCYSSQPRSQHLYKRAKFTDRRRG